MKLCSMAMTTKEKKKMEVPSQIPTKASAPQYPYGLSITLEKECLDKLDMEADDFEIGQVLTIQAKVKVTRLSMNMESDYSSQSVGLQITDLALGPSGMVAKYNQKQEAGPGE